MHRSAFTLIELLVVVAVISVLSIVVVLTLNPVQLIEQSRDSTRISDMNTLTSAISNYLAQGSTNLGNGSTTYISIPDPLATSTAGDQCQGLGLPALPASDTYQCASAANYRNVNGTGWIPLNFTSLATGAPLAQLPIDPVNQSSSDLYYTYTTNGTQYQITADFESQKYIPMEVGSGGLDPNLYTVGSNLSLAPYVGGMIGSWPLNEGSGSVAYDQSGYANNGTWSGTQMGTGGTFYATGYNQSYAGYFDGSTDYLTAPSSSNYALSGNFTISFWAKGTSTSAREYALSIGAQPQNMDFDFNDSVGLYLYWNGGGGNAILIGSPGTYSNANWHQVAVERQGSSLILYIDGQSLGTANYSGTIGGNHPVTIGKNPIVADNWTGLIDDVRIYNRALSAAQIAAMYAGGK